jgi:hypothetical protein
MTDEEQIMISAVRYALGRKTYIVGVTVDYMLEKLSTMSKQCRGVMLTDIQSTDDYGMDMDKKEWKKLESALEKNIGA